MEILNRYYIRMAVVLLALSLGLSACSDGGGVTDPGPPPPGPEQTPTTITSSFESEDTNFLPGEVQLIAINGTTLTEAEYVAAMNGAEVLLYRYEEDTDNKTLVFIIPEEASQSHELAFTLDGQEQTLDFTIEAYEVIEDPVVFVEDLTNEYTSQLDAIINDTQEADIADLLQQTKEELAGHFEEFKALKNEEQALVARLIYSKINTTAAETTAATEFETQSDLSCPEAKSILDAQTKRMVKTAIVLATGSVLLGTPIAPLSFIVSGIMVARLLTALEPLLDISLNAAVVCILEEKPSLVFGNSATSSINQASQAGLSFTHDEAQSFTIKVTYDIDGEVKALLKTIRETLKPFYSIMPQKWVDTISKTNYVEERTEDPAAYSIDAISDGRISSTTGIEGEKLSVTFNYDEEDMPTDAQDFTFELGKQNGDDPALVEATLQPALPIAYDMQIAAEEGESIKGTLKADYAATFTIESDGKHGEVTLLNETTGEFGYDRGSSFTDTDSFTFSATNSTGTSEMATVNIQATSKPPLPVAYDMQITVEEGQSIQGTLKADNAANFTIESGGEHGTVTLLNETTGEFGYDRGSSFTDTDSFTFSATNSAGTSEVATVTIQATSKPLLPVAYDMQITVEGESIQGTLKADNAETFTIESNGQHGTVTLVDKTTGQFSYTRGSSFIDYDSFTFSAINISGTSKVATVTILAASPIAYDMQITIEASKSSIEGTLKADNARTFTIESNGEHGELTFFDNTTGQFVYTLGSSYTDTDTFTFSATNISGTSEVATVFVEGTHIYELQIGEYGSDTFTYNPIKTIGYGDNLTVPNYMLQLVRVTLNGEIVKVREGKESLEWWTTYKFGEEPISGENIVLNDHKINFYDAENNKTVTIKIGELTLTNAGYSAIVGKTVKITKYIDGKPLSDSFQLYRFNTDGTLDIFYADGSKNITTEYQFHASRAESLHECPSYTFNPSLIGAVHVGLEQRVGGDRVGVIRLHKDGSIGKCFDYEDPNFNGFKFEYVNK